MWEIDDSSPVIAFAGDWHGHDAGVEEKLQRLSAHGITRLFHVGNFMICPDRSDRLFLHRVNSWAESTGIRIGVTSGSHEDWSYLQTAFAAAGDGNPAEIRSHIAALPRGYRWTQRGRSFVSYGGAASMASESRVTDPSWWRDEIPTPADFAALEAGGGAEVMITHDSPVPGTSKVDAIRRSSDGWSDDALIYAELGSRGITAAWEAVCPDLLVHGHFHVQDEISLPSGQRIFSLAAENDPGNVLLLNLDTLQTSWLEEFDD